MKRSKGSILAIVLIIMAALYLLAGMMFMVNRQYFSDIGLAQDSAMNRQKLLNAGKSLITVQGRSDQRTITMSDQWSQCDLWVVPEYGEANDLEVFQQYLPLAEYCSDGHVSHRIWLASLDNLEDYLVIDHLKSQDDWQNELIIENHVHVDVIQKDEQWILVLDNGVLHKEIILIEEENLPLLTHRFMRVNQLNYELLLFFEDAGSQQVDVYHLWIPINELYFESSRTHRFQLLKERAHDHNDWRIVNIDDEQSQNWQMTLTQQVIDSVLIRNNVIFVSLHDREVHHQSIIAMYLSGQSFFGDDIAGFEYSAIDQKIELISCLYRKPLMLDQWIIGCDIQQKIRYYFPE